VLKAAASADVRWFVIDMLPVSLVDTTGLYALRDTFELLHERGIVVGIARREPEWLRRAIDSGFTDLAWVALLSDAAPGRAGLRRGSARTVAAAYR